QSHWYHSSIFVSLTLTAEHLARMLRLRFEGRLGEGQLRTAALGDNVANVQGAAPPISNGERYGCTAHMVQLAVKDTLAQFREATAVVNSVSVCVLFFFFFFFLFSFFFLVLFA